MTPTSNGDAQQTLTTYRVLVIGGGNAGLSVAGRLQRAGVDDVTVIEPREHHVYQPLLSHVAGGTAKASQAMRPQGDVMPARVTLIRDSVTSVEPESSSLVLASGRRIGYEHLIVCPGIVQDWDAIPGLRAALGTPTTASSYEIGLADKTSRLLRELREGTVVFVQAPEPASFAGAIQKPMYLACDYWRSHGVLDRIRVVLVLPETAPLGVPAIDLELERRIADYGIEVRRESRLHEVLPDAKTAVISSTDADTGADADADADADDIERISYDALIVEPPQRAPTWISESGLARASTGATPDPEAHEGNDASVENGENGENGENSFVDVDGRTLQHRRFANVWALGDAAASRSQRSGGALRKQTKALAENLVSVLGHEQPQSQYDGYTVAPFTVSRSSVVFGEFDSEGRQRPSIPFWKGLARERRLTWVFDRHVLPWVYWNLILKGRA
ncbi:MAG: NAD(P)/FAD-dependent oxidoreductase [Pseudoclavibacter sp.]